MDEELDPHLKLAIFRLAERLFFDAVRSGDPPSIEREEEAVLATTPALCREQSRAGSSADGCAGHATAYRRTRSAPERRQLACGELGLDRARIHGADDDESREPRGSGGTENRRCGGHRPIDPARD